MENRSHDYVNIDLTIEAGAEKQWEVNLRMFKYTNTLFTGFTSLTKHRIIRNNCSIKFVIPGSEFLKINILLIFSKCMMYFLIKSKTYPNMSYNYDQFNKILDLYFTLHYNNT
jgi:hypothetical protein